MESYIKAVDFVWEFIHLSDKIYILIGIENQIHKGIKMKMNIFKE